MGQCVGLGTREVLQHCHLEAGLVCNMEANSVVLLGSVCILMFMFTVFCCSHDCILMTARLHVGEKRGFNLHAGVILRPLVLALNGA